MRLHKVRKSYQGEVSPLGAGNEMVAVKGVDRKSIWFEGRSLQREG